MSNQSDFSALEARIRAIAAGEVKVPVIPPGIYAQESEDLAVWAVPDLPRLTAAGLDANLVHELPTRVGAFRYTQSGWNSSRFTKEEAQKQFALLAPAAYDLRARLVHDMLFAYRRHADLKGRVQAIYEGTGDADMIQDLSDLAVHGRKNPAPLAAMGFDMALLAEAEGKSQELASLLASSRGEKATDSDVKVLRDKAYTHLKAAVDEIREVGQYVFWRDEARLKGYGSAYKRSHRSTADATTADTASTADAP